MDTKATDWTGSEVKHNGENIGVVTEIRANMQNGRRYAFVQPHDPDHCERRLPVDELTLVEGV